MIPSSERSLATNLWIAVGDIHGCPRQLREILELGRQYPDHRWIFLGDYIDRGPDSEGVISLLRTLNAVFLLGNHEQMLLHWNSKPPMTPYGFVTKATTGHSPASWSSMDTMPSTHPSFLATASMSTPTAEEEGS